MPDWLASAFKSDADFSLSLVATRLITAFLLGCLVAAIDWVTRGPSAGRTPSLTATLVLLTVLISMTTLVIGESIARAFSIVGALSIVRFRTVVEDTRDTAFVIFAVGIGLAVGAGFLLVPLTAIPVAGAAAFLFRSRRPDEPRVSPDHVLIVRVGTASGDTQESLLADTLSRHAVRTSLTAVSTARQGAAFERTYAVRLRDEVAASALVTDLHRLAGVQSVELRRA